MHVNEDFKLTTIKKKLSEIDYKEHLPFITIGLASGIISCLYAILFSKIEKVSQSIITNQPELFFIIAPASLIAAFLVVKYFSPESFGSGIPQVIFCLNTENLNASKKFLSVRVILAKILSSLLGIFGGAAIGREGPSLQISAAIGHNIGQYLNNFGYRIKKNQLIIAGAASGLAAAFNTPIGGIVYAIEELAQDHIRSYRTALLMSVLIAGFTAQLIMGNYLYLGYPALLNYINLELILIVSAVGFVCGVLGALFSKILINLIRWRKSLNTRNQIAVVFLIGIGISFSFYFFGERFVFSGKDSINHILFSKEPLTVYETIARFVSPLMSSMTGIAGGIFAPSLSAGASIGGFSSYLFDPAFRTILGLTGMIGFLTGVTHTPITSFVLVLEMTDRHSSVLPMILAALFSSIGARIISSHSFYEEAAAEINFSDDSNPKK